MAYQVRHFAVTVPAGTLQAAPQVTEITVPVMRLLAVDWHLPPGCVGLVGFLLSMGGIPVQPLPTGTFVVGDNRYGHWTLEDAPDSGAWEVTAFNLGLNPHTIQVDLHLEPIIRPEPALELIDPRQLSRYTTMLGGPGD